MSAIQNEVISNLGVDKDTYLTLKSSIFPGAKDESIAMAISYCKAAKLDIMQKPVHIVKMNVKTGAKSKDNKDVYEYRDVIMPGITLYRIQASRSGLCAGIDEPEFGPTITAKLGGFEVSYPEWCKITVRKLVNGSVCEFSAKEFWVENYATQSKDNKSPNMMWAKRPFGQLAKCSESQAWRKAFPELFGGIYTAEEMEGKHVVANIENSPKPDNLSEFVSEDQIIYLKDKFVDAETDEMDVLNHFMIGCLEEMRVRDFLMIDRMLDKKIVKKQEKSLKINELLN